VFTAASKSSFQDELRQRDFKVFSRWLSPDLIRQAATHAGVAFGRGPLHLANLVWLALGCALRPMLSFTGVLGLVFKLLFDAPDFPGSTLDRRQRRSKKQAGTQARARHDPRGHGDLTVTEEAFSQARKKLPWAFWTALTVLLAENFQRQHQAHIRWKGLRLLTLDGTCLKLERWQSLVEHFGTASNGRGRCNPQARLVMLQLPMTRLPWKYDLTPLADSEIAVAKRLLAGLSSNDLVLMDRGFFSYGLFWQIQQQGAFFATRLKARIRLRTVTALADNDRLVCWEPSDWRKQWKKQGLPEQMSLRVIDYQMKGFRPSAIVTNMLDAQLLPAAEWVRLAVVDKAGQVLEPAGLYHRRWEIETTFAELKVTQGLEGQLRSRSPEGIRFEVAGHILLYTMVRWLMVEAAEEAGLADPLRLSFAEALRELGEMRQTLLLNQEERVNRVLLPRLLERVASQRVPMRPGRHYARPLDKKPKNKGKGRYQKSSTLGTVGADSGTSKKPKGAVPKTTDAKLQEEPQQAQNMVA
jgi:hypothetical protein